MPLFTAAVALVLSGGLATGALAAEWQQQRVTSADGLPLQVVSVGSPGQPGILFLHGFSQSLLSWEAQLNDTELADSFHLVALDLRGHGNSGKPWSKDAYEPEDWAADIDAVIKATGLQQPTVVAWSFGTLVAMDYLRSQGSGHIAGWVLVGSAGRLVTPPPAAASAPPADRSELLQQMLSQDIRSNIVSAQAATRQLTLHAMPVTWTSATAAAYMMTPPYAKNLIGAGRASNADLVARLANAPMLLMRGASDPIVSAATLLELQKQLANSRIVTFADSGHAPFAEHPAQFNRALADFVASLKRQAIPDSTRDIRE
ncbi:MAG: alpha/beta hydrolase [Gammaproteobacteria bacterium]|nr:alpha/beta hydrolase [Gammaproteobacteria bacterium]